MKSLLPNGSDRKNSSNLLISFVFFVLLLDNSTSFDINYLYSIIVSIDAQF